MGDDRFGACNQPARGCRSGAALMHNRGNGYEMSWETERRMKDSRDMLKEHFGMERDDGYENERE